MAATIGRPAHSIVYHTEILRAYTESRILLVKRETELVMKMLKQPPVATHVTADGPYWSNDRPKLFNYVESELQRVRADIAEIDRQFRFKEDAKP